MAYWLDDEWDGGPLIRAAGTAAFGLYSRCGLWIARHRTDGHVPGDVAADYGSKEWAARLVAVGLWAISGDGYQDLHYLKLNPSAEKVEQRRQQKAERQERWRDKQKGRRVSRRDGDASKDGLVTMPPTQPPSKEGLGGAPAPLGAARPPDPPYVDADDPQELAEYREEIAHLAEASTRSLADQRTRARNGAAAVRAYLAKNGQPPEGAA